MPIAISIIIANEKVPAELNDFATARAIADALPIETRFSTWGDEIYFPIPVKRGSENGKSVVELGELGYWPPGNAFCIFYGATPGSTEDHIEPASPVNPIGKVSGDPKIFRSLARKSGTIRLEKA
ncbi:MAG: cyclophilin-like fold protein [Candidatus Latescibacterota bacterium]